MFQKIPKDGANLSPQFLLHRPSDGHFDPTEYFHLHSLKHRDTSPLSVMHFSKDLGMTKEF